MRGRIDVSEGFPRPAPAGFSVNLLQQFDYGLGLSRILQLKERSPAPNLGTEVVPVLIVDELKKSAYPPRSFVIASRLVSGGGVTKAWVGVNCRGASASQISVQNDRLVVHWIRINVSSVTNLNLEVGRTSGVIGLSGGFAMRCDSTLDQPAVGALRSDFTGTLVGESADAADGDAQNFIAVANQECVFDGPFIIGQGEGVFVYQQPAVPATLSVTFFCEEFPGP